MVTKDDWRSIDIFLNMNASDFEYASASLILDTLHAISGFLNNKEINLNKIIKINLPDLKDVFLSNSLIENLLIDICDWTLVWGGNILTKIVETIVKKNKININFTK